MEMIHTAYLFCINRVICHLRVVPLDKSFDRGIILVDEELQEHEVHDTQPKSHPPEHGVRANEGAVGKGQCGDYHEENEHSQNTGEEIRVIGQRSIPER